MIHWFRMHECPEVPEVAFSKSSGPGRVMGWV